MKRGQSLRIAIRKFDPFDSAIRKQWNAFEAAAHTGLTQEADNPVDQLSREAENRAYALLTPVGS
jgi:hypothetical protein